MATTSTAPTTTTTAAPATSTTAAPDTAASDGPLETEITGEPKDPAAWCRRLDELLGSIPAQDLAPVVTSLNQQEVTSDGVFLGLTWSRAFATAGAAPGLQDQVRFLSYQGTADLALWDEFTWDTGLGLATVGETEDPQKTEDFWAHAVLGADGALDVSCPQPLDDLD